MAHEIQLHASRTSADMAEPLHESILPIQSNGEKPHKEKSKLALLPLVFLIYFEVSGGPYGSEQTVQAGGPLLAILGFVLFPFVWSIPEALITAELATALPGNGGFVLWTDRAFGPFPGSLMGSWKFLSGAINSAAYPALCADYIARAIPSISSGAPRVVTVTATTILLSFLNYTGLSVVGYTAMVLCAASLSPFFLMAAAGLPKLHPRRWGAIASDRDWRLFFNTLFWNLNFWDNASTLAGEVDRPQRTFPRALLAAGLLTSAAYLVPLLIGTAVLDVPYSSWDSGFYADAAGMIAGHWLKYWIEVGAVLSAIGLYEAQLSSAAFQLLGMADLGFLPKLFSLRSKWFDTPWVGIVTSSLISLGISFLTLDDIISSANFLYSLGMLLEIASFLWLRRKEPRLKRPFRVPLRKPWLIFMCALPSAFLIYVMTLASWRVFAVSGGLTLFGCGLYFSMELCKKKGCLMFGTLGEMVGEMEEEEEEEVKPTFRNSRPASM
ncbi:putative polyamine transporter [Platanthera zijinensis]|uniref:Polyamine transporter PUT1 n=1 Tax=Platanthera zijinensis TaxID=2320716 RepID=A0AAP0BGN5_9ASPA